MIDRDISFGYEGAVYSEVKAAACRQGMDTRMINFIAGISGRDITMENIREMYELLEKKAKGEEIEEIQFTGLRWK
ncbi:hypothetical protein SDC9_207849 [bioreactor metagenome]|uniref:Pyruvate:ferredoxin oxidoreductase core domain-containing protein n=1 Tax=bioreactor metagenome TaxID=1076179 RepID=A0A645JIG9_9ZZZZ